MTTKTKATAPISLLAAWGLLEGFSITAGTTPLSLALLFMLLAPLAYAVAGGSTRRILSWHDRKHIQPAPDWQLGKGLIAVPNPGPDQCPVCGMDDLGDRRKVGLTVPYGKFEAHESCKELVPVPADMMATAHERQRQEYIKTSVTRVKQNLQSVARMSPTIARVATLTKDQEVIRDAVLGNSTADVRLYLQRFVADLRQMHAIFPATAEFYWVTVEDAFLALEEELACVTMEDSLMPIGTIDNEVKLFAVREIVREFSHHV
jgi:hypothetical protein